MSESHAETLKSQMAQTRSCLAEKLETLEHIVVRSVGHAGAAVEATIYKVLGMVDHCTTNVGDTIAKATTTVGGAIDSLKSHVESTEDTLKSSIQAVREHVNLTHMVGQHPWGMMGGAVAVGYWLGHVLDSSSSTHEHHESLFETRIDALPSRTDFSSQNAESQGDASPASPGSSSPASDSQPSTKARLSRVLAPHVTQLQGIAVGSIMSLVRDVLTKSLSPAWSGPVANAIDDLTRELGGKPVERA